MSYPDYDTPRLTGVLAEIHAERARQDEKWGEQNHPDGTGPRVAVGVGLCHAEDAAVAARRACQAAARKGETTWRRIIDEEHAEAIAEDDPTRLRAELVQVAAVAVAWVEAIDRRTAAEAPLVTVQGPMDPERILGAEPDATLDADEQAPVDARLRRFSTHDIDVCDRDRRRAAERIEVTEAERDGAYRERAHLLAWLATHYPAVIAPAPDVEEPGWQLLYLTAPTGQLSWHIAPRDASLFAHVQRVTTAHPRAQWDGHTTEEKYERIRLLPARAETERDSVKRVGPTLPIPAERYADEQAVAALTRQQDATSAEDACRVVEVGGEPIRVRGSGEMSDESRAALASLVGAARAKYVAEHPDGAPVISPRVAAHVLWQEGLGGYAAGPFTTALLKAWWAADPANAARLARTWPEYGVAIALLGQPGGTEQLRAITGEQPTPDRP